MNHKNWKQHGSPNYIVIVELLIAVCDLSYSYDYKEQRVPLQNIHKPTYNIHGKQKTEVKQVYNPF